MTAAKATTEERQTEERRAHPVDPKMVKGNHLMAFTYYGKVIAVEYQRPGAYGDYGENTNLRVMGVDDAPKEFGVRGDALITNAASADYYAEEVVVTQTRAAELLVGSTRRPFTVVFVKLDGTERTLRGRLLAPEPLMGRSHVEDLDIGVDDKGGRVRLIDHRTIKSLVVDGVKYAVKDKGRKKE